MKLRILIGLLISGVFIYLAFNQVDMHEMAAALKEANYLWLLPALLFMFVSHGLRAFRWGYFLGHIKKIRLSTLFSSLMIGYAANNVFPLRLGEFLRAFAIGKSTQVPKSSAFATIIVERLIDVLTLLLLLAGTILFYPLPNIIKKSGYIIFTITVGLIILLVFLMEKTEATIRVFKLFLVTLPRKLDSNFNSGEDNTSNSKARSIFIHLLVHMPQRAFDFVQKVVRSFLNGFVIFKRSEHYFTVVLLSILIWVLYAGMVYVAFYAFDFNTKYHLDFFASLVVLVTVSIGIMIPSSPGFVGTYHWFCMISLAFFKVPESEALSFAIVSHAVNFIPSTIVGLLFFWKENLHFHDAITEKSLVEHELETTDRASN